MTCAFTVGACESDPGACVLVDGCIRQRFPSHFVAHTKPISELKTSAPALNGTKPKTVRDPRFVKRNRKALTR